MPLLLRLCSLGHAPCFRNVMLGAAWSSHADHTIMLASCLCSQWSHACGNPVALLCQLAHCCSLACQALDTGTDSLRHDVRHSNLRQMTARVPTHRQQQLPGHPGAESAAVHHKRPWQNSLQPGPGCGLPAGGSWIPGRSHGLISAGLCFQGRLSAQLQRLGHLLCPWATSALHAGCDKPSSRLGPICTQVGLECA